MAKRLLFSAPTGDRSRYDLIVWDDPTCPTCNGEGMVESPQAYFREAECPDCGGTGKREK